METKKIISLKDIVVDFDGDRILHAMAKASRLLLNMRMLLAYCSSHRMPQPWDKSPSSTMVVLYTMHTVPQV